MSIDETIGVFAEVLRPVRDGGQDGAHQQEDDGHDDQDDVAVRCNVELKMLRRLFQSKVAGKLCLCLVFSVSRLKNLIYRPMHRPAGKRSYKTW